MADFVDCPYCGAENEMFDYWKNSNAFDHECEECEKVFEVEVNFDPVFYAQKINYEKCRECGKYFRCFDGSNRKVCPTCYYRTVVLRGC